MENYTVIIARIRTVREEQAIARAEDGPLTGEDVIGFALILIWLFICIRVTNKLFPKSQDVNCGKVYMAFSCIFFLFALIGGILFISVVL